MVIIIVFNIVAGVISKKFYFGDFIITPDYSGGFFITPAYL